jgi:hypothetical protein
VQTVVDSAFSFCTSLASVSLPQVQTVGILAFTFCASLTSVSLPQVQTVGNYAFYSCASLTSVSLPQVQTVGDYAFHSCASLTSFYFNGNAPTIGDGIFTDIPANQVTNYVTNPTATGWVERLGDMPVVRLPLHADAITLNGVTHTNWPSADVSGLAGTDTVTLVSSALGTHTNDAGIHVTAGDKELINAVPGLAPTNSPTILNPTVRGWIAMPQSAATNLVLRLVTSNEHIYVEEVYQ